MAFRQDGKHFTADDLDYPLWLDYGMDNYAGVTWNNTGDRHVLIGWMNNWQYADRVPCSPWRSAMTLPRELKLVEYNGTPHLTSAVIGEISGIADEWNDVTSTFDAKDAYQLHLELDLNSKATSHCLMPKARNSLSTSTSPRRCCQYTATRLLV